MADNLYTPPEGIKLIPEIFDLARIAESTDGFRFYKELNKRARQRNLDSWGALMESLKGEAYTSIQKAFPELIDFFKEVDGVKQEGQALLKKSVDNVDRLRLYLSKTNSPVSFVQQDLAYKNMMNKKMVHGFDIEAIDGLMTEYSGQVHSFDPAKFKSGELITTNKVRDTNFIVGFNDRVARTVKNLWKDYRSGTIDEKHRHIVERMIKTGAKETTVKQGEDGLFRFATFTGDDVFKDSTSDQLYEYFEKGIQIHQDIHNKTLSSPMVEWTAPSSGKTYKMYAHERAYIEDLTSAMKNNITMVAQNGFNYDIPNIIKSTVQNGSAGAAQAAINELSPLANYVDYLDPQMVDKEWLSGSGYLKHISEADRKAIIRAGETASTNTAQQIRVNKEILKLGDVAHVASTDVLRMITATVNNQQLPTAIAELAKTEQSIAPIKEGSILLANSSYSTIHNGTLGGIAFTVDPVTKSIRHMDSFISNIEDASAEHNDFGLTLKRNSSYLVGGIKAVEASDTFAKEAAKVDPSIIGKELVSVMLMPMRGKAGEAKSAQPIYLLATQSYLEAEMGKAFIPLGSVSLDNVPGRTTAEKAYRIAQGDWAKAEIDTTDVPERIKDRFSVKKKSGKVEYRPKNLIGYGTQASTEGYAYSSFSRSLYSKASDLHAINARVQELMTGGLTKEAVIKDMFHKVKAAPEKAFEVLGQNIKISSMAQVDNLFGLLPHYSTMSPLLDKMRSAIDHSNGQAGTFIKNDLATKWMSAFKEAMVASGVLPKDFDKKFAPELADDENIWEEDIIDMLPKNPKQIPKKYANAKSIPVQLRLDDITNWSLGTTVKTITGDRNENVALMRFARRTANKYNIDFDAYFPRAKEQRDVREIQARIAVMLADYRGNVDEEAGKPSAKYHNTVSSFGKMAQAFDKLPKEQQDYILEIANRTLNTKFYANDNETLISDIIKDVLFDKQSLMPEQDMIEHLVKNGHTKPAATRIAHTMSLARQDVETALGDMMSILQKRIGKTDVAPTFGINKNTRKLFLYAGDQQLDLSDLFPVFSWSDETKRFTGKVGKMNFMPILGVYKTGKNGTLSESTNIYDAYKKTNGILYAALKPNANAQHFTQMSNFFRKQINDLLRVDSKTVVNAVEDAKNGSLYRYEDLIAKLPSIMQNHESILAAANYDFAETFDVLKELDPNRSLTAKQRYVIHRDRFAILDAIFGSQDIVKELFNSEPKDVEHIRNTLYSLNSSQKHPERFEGVMGRDNDSPLLGLGKNEGRGVAAMLNRSTALQDVDKITERDNLSIEKGTGLVSDNKIREDVLVDNSVRAVRLDMSTKQQYDLIYGEEFQNYLVQEFGEENASKISSILAHHLEDGSSLLNPHIAKMMPRITQQTFDESKMLSERELIKGIKNGEEWMVNTSKRRIQQTRENIRINEQNQQITFLYNQGVHVEGGDVAGIADVMGTPTPVKVTKKGILTGHYFKQATGKVASEEEINEILNMEKYANKIRSAIAANVENDPAFLHDVVADILKEHGMIFKRHVVPTDEPLTRKIILNSGEKSSTDIAEVAVGQLDKRLGEFLDKLGLKDARGEHYTEAYWDSLFNGKGAYQQAKRYVAAHMEEKVQDFDLYMNTLAQESGFEGFREVREAVRKEGTTAWDAFEDFLKKKGYLRAEDTLGAISSSLYDTIRHQSFQALLDTSLNTQIRHEAETIADNEGRKVTHEDMKEATKRVAANIQDKGLEYGTVVADGTQLKFSKDTIWNQDFIYGENGLFRNVLHDSQLDNGSYKFFSSITLTNDEDNAGVIGDDPDKGMKLSERSIVPLIHHGYAQSQFDNIAEKYSKLYGEDAERIFNSRFDGLAKMENGTVKLFEGVEGKRIYKDFIQSLNEQIEQRGMNLYATYSVKENKETGLPEGKWTYHDEEKSFWDPDAAIQRKEFKLNSVARNQLQEAGLSFDEIEGLKRAFNGDINVSTDYALSTYSARKSKEAQFLNESFKAAGSDPEKIQAALTEAKKHNFHIIENIKDINTSALYNTLDQNSLWGNNLIIDLGAGFEKNRYVALGYVKHSPIGGEYGEDVRNKLQAEISILQSKIEEVQAGAADDSTYRSIEEHIGNIHEESIAIAGSKNGVVATEATTRARRSFSAKGGIEELRVGQNKQLLQTATFFDKSVAERIEKGLQTNVVFVGKDRIIDLLGGHEQINQMAKILGEDSNEYLDKMLQKAKTEGITSIVVRPPGNYVVSDASVQVYLDETLGSNRIKTTHHVAVAMQQDNDGDKPAVMAAEARGNIRNQQGELVAKNVALSSAEVNSLVEKGMTFEYSGMNLHNQLQQAAEIQALSISKDALNHDNSYRGEYEGALPDGRTLSMENADDVAIIARKKATVFDGKLLRNNPFLENIDTPQESHQYITEARNRFKAITESEHWSGPRGAINYNEDDLIKYGEEYLTKKYGNNKVFAEGGNPTEYGKDWLAINAKWAAINEAETVAKKAQQNSTGLLNSLTYRWGKLMNALEADSITEDAQIVARTIKATIDDEAQASKHGEIRDIRELQNKFLDAIGYRQKSMKIDEFVEYLDKDMKIFEKMNEMNKIEDRLKTGASENGEKILTKEDFRRAMYTIFKPESGQVVNPEWWDNIARQETYKFTTGNTPYQYVIDDPYSPIARMTQQIESSVPQNEESIMKSAPVMIDGSTYNKEYSVNYNGEGASKSRSIEDFTSDMENSMENMQSRSASEMIDGIGSRIKNMSSNKKLMALAGLAGAVFGAGLVGGSPTEPADGQAQGLSAQQNVAYDLPSLMGNMMPQVQSANPTGYIVNVNAASSQGQEFISHSINSALMQTIPQGNINMTMNINDSSSNITVRDIAQYITSAL